MTNNRRRIRKDSNQSIPTNTACCENTQWPTDWKRSTYILIAKKENVIDSANYHKVSLISNASKIGSSIAN